MQHLGARSGPRLERACAADDLYPRDARNAAALGEFRISYDSGKALYRAISERNVSCKHAAHARRSAAARHDRSRSRPPTKLEIGQMRDIILPEVKPALEWIGGRAVQKVSPRRKHALAQTRFAMALETWARAGGRGTVGTEWEFRLKPPGEMRRPLVPDVAFISFERLPFDDEAASDMPHVAPDVVVEILSPSDRITDIDEKT